MVTENIHHVLAPCVGVLQAFDADGARNVSEHYLCQYDNTTPPETTLEEAGLIALILLLWLCAILLFINRWGKIRMLEPYMPAFKTTESGLQDPLTNNSTQANSLEEGDGSGAAVAQHFVSRRGSPYVSTRRSRQNSLMQSMPSTRWSAVRRVKSAVDLVSLVIAERREATAEQRRSRFQQRSVPLSDDRQRQWRLGGAVTGGGASDQHSVRLDCSFCSSRSTPLMETTGNVATPTDSAVFVPQPSTITLVSINTEV